MPCKYWLLFGSLGLGAIQTVGCSSKFRTCETTYTCPKGGAGGTAGTSAAGGDGGKASNDAGTSAGGTGGEHETHRIDAGDAGSTVDNAGSGGEAGDSIGGKSEEVAGAGGATSNIGGAASGIGGAGASSMGGGCPSNTTNCNGSCYATGSDASHCGATCKQCASGQVCNAGQCECQSGAYACGGCLSWDFEWAGNSPSPWLAELNPNWSGKNGASNVLLSHSQYQSPGTSLGAPVLIDVATSATAEVSVPPCRTGEAVNLAGYELSASVLLIGPELTTWSDAFQLDAWGPSGPSENQVLLWGSQTIPTGTWFSVRAKFMSGTPVTRVGLRLTPSSNWVGTMYIDDVVIKLALWTAIRRRRT